MSEIVITKEELESLIDPDSYLKAVNIVESKVESLKSKPVSYRVFFNLFKVKGTLYEQYKNALDHSFGLVGGGFYYYTFKGGDLTFEEYVVLDTDKGGDGEVTRLLNLALFSSVDKYSKITIPVKVFSRLERLMEFSKEIVEEYERREN